MLTIYPKVCNSSSTRALNGAKVSAPMQTDSHPKQTKYISFGDDSSTNYSYRDTLFKYEYGDDKVILQDNSAKDTFQKFYQMVQSDLSMARIKAKGGDTVEDIFVTENRYVNAMLGFVNDYGNVPRPADMHKAIDNHIINKVGIEKPKWWKFFEHNEFSDLKGLMKGTCDLLKEGIIRIRK